MITKPATGSARYSDGKLTITTQAKRGKKTVPNVVVYTVEDVRPDPRVAYPAYALKKDDGEVYHVAVDKFGPTCSCPHATFRGQESRVPCKHVLAMIAVGLVTKSLER